MRKRLAAIYAVTVCVCACGGSPQAPSPVPIDLSSSAPSAAGPPSVLIAAGDIALCGTEGSELTARLIDSMDGTGVAAGDNAYPSGRIEDYRNCYQPSWGRHLDRTRPTPGNHEYETPGATAYFQYFGPNAGPAGRGYYSYTLGSWHIVSLNSETDLRAGSPQEQWLRADLQANRTACTAAYWHRPRFSSGKHGNNTDMQDLWRVLYEFHVDVAISGHDHLYERFAPQDASGRADPERGIRQFVAGTGGAAMHAFNGTAANSEAQGFDWGVLKLTLGADAYSWEFVPAAGGSFHDSGTYPCH